MMMNRRNVIMGFHIRMWSFTFVLRFHFSPAKPIATIGNEFYYHEFLNYDKFKSYSNVVGVIYSLL